ncbi:hypothetical protein GCM10010918_53230 [Paenibacillus radicis (ex Gao et al. 2016)]|uniref:Uncharacterized protein n=1 Tax=Paenibacillus radicis (ex Gao et al. 2016) TaxID=1737354 RepID=A0A917M9P6_9BACL|nr:hypothetical protein GCM10010918_53230 [Paenibacillus radicis (ex Gao et al. 2016)]
MKFMFGEAISAIPNPQSESPTIAAIIGKLVTAIVKTAMPALIPISPIDRRRRELMRSDKWPAIGPTMARDAG